MAYWKIQVRSSPNCSLCIALYSLAPPGRPKGYEAERPILKELVGTENLDDDRILYTSQPGIPMSATLADHPDGWTECMLPADVKRLILATPGFPSPIVRPHAISYRVAPSAGKGQGMFSTRHIRAGDLILSERPLTISPAMITTRVRSQRELTAHEKLQAQLYEWEQALKIMFDRLLPEHKVAFMALANSHQHDGSGPIGGIVRTNAVGLGNYQTERTKKYKATYQTRNHDKLTAICKEISRLNHSCSPNTTTHWDMASFSFQLYAVRDIPAGDELTYPYVGWACRPTSASAISSPTASAAPAPPASRRRPRTPAACSASAPQCTGSTTGS
ncbi:hypothetical protein B0H10DRAFT_497916 [Mycena sp. CBHHK59/15]|nr:hypothetical protein B0H10DRAFT_497916 [Mycena sp. CBHHK59/15]